MHCTREQADSLDRLLPEAGAVILDAALGERRRRYRGVMEVSLTTSLPGHFISSYSFLLLGLLQSFLSSAGTFTFGGSSVLGSVKEKLCFIPWLDKSCQLGKSFEEPSERSCSEASGRLC